ncbi:MAG: NPCBM/NEW2 domain-containing protein [Nostoc sp.]|uniref:NPCBM/NEW2 domain-containing protein n=1 Tax=Nostoc sp. TaxID=1180 RepID=UPI002FF5E56F
MNFESTYQSKSSRSRYYYLMFTLFSTILTLIPFTAFAKVEYKVPLPTAHCIKEPALMSENKLSIHTEEVTIGRQLLDSIFSLAVGYSSDRLLVICRIQSKDLPSFSKFSTMFGIKDDADNAYSLIAKGSQTKVNFYLDGEQVASQTLKSGQITVQNLDLTGKKNLAIEVSCARGGSSCASVNFINAFLF